jgi:excisionase family DNA binding protein
MATQVEKLAVGMGEAASMLGVSPRTIQNYISRNHLTVRKLGRRTLIPVQVLRAFVANDHCSQLEADSPIDTPETVRPPRNRGTDSGQ